MKVLIVHNSYGCYSGEEAVVQNCMDLLAANGHSPTLFARSSDQISKIPFGKVRAFFSGIFSINTRWQFRQVLDKIRPQIVHVHNLFPLISPSILPECSRVGVPVVMSVHNYRLLCPNGTQMPKKTANHCQICIGGREYWCILKNCQASLARSIGYAARSYLARRLGLFRDHVWLYACLAGFQRQILVNAGYPPERVEVLENMVQSADTSCHIQVGSYVGFAGRVSPEKGIEVLLEAARSCQDIPFLIAGNTTAMPGIVDRRPSNCTFLGQLSPTDIRQFFRNSRLVVVPSIWHEPFGLCAAEAQASGKPVICSSIGALPEIVVDGVTGLLFEPGNAKDLTTKIRYLWQRPDLCMAMGKAGWQHAKDRYSPERYYRRLMWIYQKAASIGPPQRPISRPLLRSRRC